MNRLHAYTVDLPAHTYGRNRNSVALSCACMGGIPDHWTQPPRPPSSPASVRQTPPNMLLRTLKQSVWRLPDPEQVLVDMQAWAQQQQERIPSLQRLGVFGSYGRGTAAFGSDLDLILVDSGTSGEQVERLQQWPLAELPLSCDALVLTPAELEQRLDRSSMAMELKRDLRWLL